MILEKQEYDIASNVNFDAVLQALGRQRFVMFGVATEYCVRSTALSLRQRGASVDLVADAIKPITEEAGAQAVAEMTTAGVPLVTSEEVCNKSA